MPLLPLSLDICYNQSIRTLKFCEHYDFEKQRQVNFSKGMRNTKGTLDYLHSDLWGPSRVPSNDGANYMLTIINDFSKRVWTFFLKHKSDVFATFKEWKIMIEKQIKCLHNDNCLEFCSDEFDALCRSEGIVRHHTDVGTPQQNRVNERMNITIMEKVRYMLSNAKLSKSFWA